MAAQKGRRGRRAPAPQETRTTAGRRGTAGREERLGIPGFLKARQQADCGPRRVPQPHQAAHGAGRGRHPRKGGRHHRKGRKSVSRADHTRDRRARRASGHAPPRLLRPLPPGNAGLPRAHCVLRRRSGQALQKRRAGYASKRMTPVAGSEKFRVFSTSRRAFAIPYSSRLPLASPPTFPRLYWRLAAGPCSPATYLSSCSSSGSAVLRLGRIGI